MGARRGDRGRLLGHRHPRLHARRRGLHRPQASSVLVAHRTTLADLFDPALSRRSALEERVHSQVIDWYLRCLRRFSGSRSPGRQETPPAIVRLGERALVHVRWPCRPAAAAAHLAWAPPTSCSPSTGTACSPSGATIRCSPSSSPDRCSRSRLPASTCSRPSGGSPASPSRSGASCCPRRRLDPGRIGDGYKSARSSTGCSRTVPGRRRPVGDRLHDRRFAAPSASTGCASSATPPAGARHRLSGTERRARA